MRIFPALVVLALAVSTTGCSGEYTRECSAAKPCSTQGGIPGVCVDSPSSDKAWCAYEDSTCPDGLRWGVLAGDGLESMCVSGEVADGGLGVDGAMPDGGGTCNDGQAQPGEQCDMSDLAGSDCMSLGFDGGDLACTAGCMFDTGACFGGTGAPTIPKLRKPINNSYVGSNFVPGTKRPQFVWEASVVSSKDPVQYELEFSADEAFGSPGTTVVMTSGLHHQPATDLVTSMVVPVGTRYYWRVRACAATCSAYSAAWRVNVGRGEKDFNGDGYADVLAGAGGDDAGGTDAGRAHLFLGGSGAFNMTADVTITGSPGEQLGSAVAWAGDLNADGFADVVVGAFSSDAVAMNAGRAYVVLGGPALDGNPDATLSGLGAGDSFGTAVASAGDVNADGYADVVVGAPYNSAAAANAGAAYLFMGGPGQTFDTTPDGTTIGTAAQDFFGSSVSAAGDMDGDGHGDLLVGAAGVDIGGVDNGGRVYLYRGAPGSFDPVPDLSYDAQGEEAFFGTGLAAAGDVNGDGFSDVVVGAWLHAVGGQPQPGAAYVFMGGPSLDGMPDGSFLPSGVNIDKVGYSVAGTGDLNGDGFSDVLVGAPEAGNGKAFVFLGMSGTNFDFTPDGTLLGFTAGANFGESVSITGDVNGDRYDDVVCGQPGDLKAFVYLGSAGSVFDVNSDATIAGGQGFGAAVAR